MKLVVIILSVFLLTSCDCGCDTVKYGKHKFNKGDIVHHKVSNQKLLIVDTVRMSECELSYNVVNSEEEHDYYVSEIELK
jgi:hypothetical protein